MHVLENSLSECQLDFSDGLFDEWINLQKPSPRWTPLILPDETLADDLLSGNASPSIQTPLANSGNITPDDDNQAVEESAAIAGPQVAEDDSHESNSGEGGGGSTIGNYRATQSSTSRPLVPLLPSQPGSRGGHQMVIDSSTQVRR